MYVGESKTLTEIDDRIILEDSLIVTLELTLEKIVREAMKE